MSFIKFWTGAAWKIVDTTNIFKVYVAGAWKDITFLRVYETTGDPPQSGWRDVWVKNAVVPAPAPPPVDPPVVPPPVVLNVTITPASPISGRSTVAPANVQAPKLSNAVAAVSNGTGPYVYSWSIVSWSSSVAPPSITVPNAAATKFAQLINEDEGFETARFKCTVQDSLGNTGQAFCDVEFRTTTTGGLA